MKKIKEIIIGTNNIGKYREICNLLPKQVKKYSPKDFKISSPDEDGKNFEENSKLKALYFSKKANLLCLSDDSGLEIDLLNGAPGIHSSLWGGPEKDFNLAMQKVFSEMSKQKKNWENENKAKFVCCLTLCWPDGKNYSSIGTIKGKISSEKKGKNGFGYDPIFIPDGYNKTFGQMESKLKMFIDHRFIAFSKIKNFFNQ